MLISRLEQSSEEIGNVWATFIRIEDVETFFPVKLSLGLNAKLRWRFGLHFVHSRTGSESSYSSSIGCHGQGGAVSNARRGLEVSRLSLCLCVHLSVSLCTSLFLSISLFVALLVCVSLSRRLWRSELLALFQSVSLISSAWISMVVCGAY